MITCLRRSQLNTVAYDACVEASEWGTIYGLSWWLDLVSPQWECLVWKSTKGQYRAVLPVPVQQRYGFRFVHQPLFCQFLALYAGESLSLDDQKLFLDALFRQYRFIASFSLSFPALSLLNTYSFARITTFQTHVLSLGQSYESIREAYKRDRKMNVKRAEKAQWTISVGNQITSLADLFRYYHEHQIQGGAHPRTYELLNSLFEASQKRGFSELWYAEKAGEIQAGAWFVTWKKRTLYLFNAANEEGRRGNARTYLIDRYLNEKAGTSGLFDFESAQVTDIANFYASFGSRVMSFYELRANQLPGWVNTLWELRNRMR
ncbi:GNAT family N-acetyltransferase [Siphonobacter sp. SORGH_AS_0500]|uniref:GNAT family N-acetyltransferase n=1 Tax=Siphonobacter sp. SORGH_AS_0500 TaxID=1864824 RepID=UPI00285BA5EE|nr:GNAT family N-acetyltransferase [Siphonobacter sp. SORGH_AS_0500]MDR6196849.1 hypothetical protein [Siphonobacter sp. SORGH_AS_0500]